MILTIIIMIIYLSGGVYWLNKLGNESKILNPIQTLVIFILWPITWYLYNR